MRGYRASASAGRARPVGPQIAVPGRLVGVRTWDLGIDPSGAVRLGGTDGKRWRTGGETTWAECLVGSRGSSRHPAGAGTPAGNCTCGLYALHPLAALDSSFWRPNWIEGSLQVAGVVEAWGRVHVHTEGFRAQYARPLAFAVIGRPRDSDYGRIIEDLAISHRAEVLRFQTALGLIEHCATTGLGMWPAAIRALLHERDPGQVRVDGMGPAT